MDDPTASTTPDPRLEPAPARGAGARLLPLLLVGLVLAVAWPVLSAELVYDDLLVVRQNPRITSLAHWKEAFSATYWEFLEPEVAERVGYWRPLATLFHTVVYSAFDGRTAAFHASSVAVHLLAVLAAYRLALRLLGRRSGAFCAALLFGLHPLNVETWAWVSAVNGALAGLFSLLALDAFLAWRSRGSPRVPLAAALWFGLALLSKETSVAVLPLAGALDLARGTGGLAERWRPAVRAYLPLAGVVALYWGARALVFGSPWAGLDRVTTDFGPDVDAVRLLRLRVELLGGGMWLLAVPTPELFRPFRPVIPAADPIFLRDLAVLAAVGIGALVAWHARARVVLAALLWMPLALLPVVLRVESLGSFPLSDRFHYLATFGVALLAVRALRSWLPPRVAVALLLAAGAAAGWASRERTADWQDEEALFRTAVAQSPESPYVHWGLGRVLLGRYRRERDPQALAEALGVFEDSADLLQRGLEGDGSIYATRQDAEQTNVGLGWCYLFEAEATGSRDFETPVSIFELALRGTPTSENAYTGLGVALQAQGKLVEAKQAYENALELNPKHVEAHHNFALLLIETGEPLRAEHHLERALALRPDRVEDLVLLAEVRNELGDRAGAREAARRAVEIAPGRPEPHTVLAAIAAGEGDRRAALAHLDDALRADPEHGRAHYLRGLELVRRGDTAGAISALRRAAELSPTDFDAHYNLTALLLQTGAVDGALPYLGRAYALAREGDALERLRATMDSLELDGPEPAYAWARSDLARGATEWARRWLDLALELDPDFGPALYARAGLARRAGDDEAALADLERFAVLAPDHFQARVDLGQLLLRAGRTGEARDALEAARAIGPPEAWEPELRKVARERVEQLLGELSGPPAPGE